MNRLFACTRSFLLTWVAILTHAEEKPKRTVRTWDAISAGWSPGARLVESAGVEQNRKPRIAEWRRAIGR